MIGVIRRCGALRKATVGESVGIEGFVSIRPVFASDGYAIHLTAVLVQRNGVFRPERGKFRRAPTEDIVTAGRHDHAAEFPRIFVKTSHVRSIGPLGILIEVSPRAKTGGNLAGLALRGIVVEHRDHGNFFGCDTAAGVAEFVAIVAPLEGEVVAVAPPPLLQTAGEIVVYFENVRDAGI